MTVKLGKKYKDTISGWEGIATGRYDFLNGCQRVSLSGEKDGKPLDYTFDVQQLVDEDGNPADATFVQAADRLREHMDTAEPELVAPNPQPRAARVGGPRDTPSRTGH